MTDLPDKRVVACNYRESTSIFSKGALAYLIWGNPGNGRDRILIFGRSRSGRWISKHESIKRLHNFRMKTVPSEHPLYSDERLVDYWESEDFCNVLNEISAETTAPGVPEKHRDEFDRLAVAP